MNNKEGKYINDKLYIYISIYIYMYINIYIYIYVFILYSFNIFHKFFDICSKSKSIINNNVKIEQIDKQIHIYTYIYIHLSCIYIYIYR